MTTQPNQAAFPVRRHRHRHGTMSQPRSTHQGQQQVQPLSLPPEPVEPWQPGQPGQRIVDSTPRDDERDVGRSKTEESNPTRHYLHTELASMAPPPPSFPPWSAGHSMPPLSDDDRKHPYLPSSGSSSKLSHGHHCIIFSRARCQDLVFRLFVHAYYILV